MATQKQMSTQTKKLKDRHDSVATAGLDATLQSLRFQDEDLSIKGGSLLAFAGLMIATSLVFVTSGSSPFMPTLYQELVALAGIYAMGVGAYFAVESVRDSKVYSRDGIEFTNQFAEFLSERRKNIRQATCWIKIGSTLFVIAVSVSVLGNLFY